jgi:uncharacterized protein YcaQ
MKLSLDAARALMLAAQELLEPPRRPARKEDVLESIRRMGALQIDTIHVVARSPYLVLWSRLGDYEPRWLDELLAEGALFEYWSHGASFLPVEEYGLYRHRMLRHLRAAESPEGWRARHSEAVNRVLQRIREAGAVRAAEFERTDGRAGVWWDWKPEKLALEELYSAGILMIARRERFQRVYDLRERVLPEWDDDRTPSEEETQRALALKAVRALGVALARWVPDYFRTSKRDIVPLLEELADRGSLVRVTVEGWENLPAYIHRDNLGLAERAASGALQPTITTLLSPFDPLVWDRARAQALFGFEYRIETYTPSARRKYGYFSLPILHRGALVGRLDPKAHRKEGIFEVKALHLEPNVGMSEELVNGLAQALRDCAIWHRTPRVMVRQSDPPHLAALLGATIT